MASLAFPTSGVVYVDTNIVIYSVEMHVRYWPVLRTLWEAVRVGGLTIVTSELTVMEVLVAPLRAGDLKLLSVYDRLFQSRDLRLLPITQPILREAAGLRAAIPALRTPDAVHAATASQARCTRFLANDGGFHHISALPVTLLNDVIQGP
jgi:predicted nucleic acid-binding protein